MTLSFNVINNVIKEIVKFDDDSRLSHGLY